MEEYFKAKEKIINLTKNNIYICDTDELIYEKLTSKKVKIICSEKLETSNYFKITYNNKNLNLAMSLLKDEVYEFSKNELNKLIQTPGRFNIIEKNKRMIIIDFAHTPEALLNVGSELKKIYPNNKIITIFGCGGDRDRKKRPLMGEASCIFSDLVIVTSDNPRTENPQQIIEDVLIGCDKKKTTYVVDRKKAIEKTLIENDNAVFLIAGKGHEKYIEVNGERSYYSDEEEVKRILDDLS
jgi:UDP-N-acetylmuramoyl-L-alanyl-D-glutamate--2,6-diaminopimelate ligase